MFASLKPAQSRLRKRLDTSLAPNPTAGTSTALGSRLQTVDTAPTAPTPLQLPGKKKKLSEILEA